MMNSPTIIESDWSTFDRSARTWLPRSVVWGNVYLVCFWAHPPICHCKWKSARRRRSLSGEFSHSPTSLSLFRTIVGSLSIDTEIPNNGLRHDTQYLHRMTSLGNRLPEEGLGWGGPTKRERFFWLIIRSVDIRFWFNNLKLVGDDKIEFCLRIVKIGGD